MSAIRITQSQVDDVIDSEHYFTAADGALFSSKKPGGYSDDKAFDQLRQLAHVTVCVLILTNGMKFVGVNTGSIDPAAFDPEFGKRDARKNAEDQIWVVLGYELRTRLKAQNEISKHLTQSGGQPLLTTDQAMAIVQMAAADGAFNSENNT